jgi:alpha-L-fucosidase
MLNVGPHASGEFCKEEVEVLKELGKFVGKNSEAIYGTEPFFIYGEGKAKAKSGGFSERDIKYTHKDFRFTFKTGALYVFAMRPNDKKGEYFISRIGTKHDRKDQFQLLVKNISLLGFDNKLEYKLCDNGLTIKVDGKLSTDLPVCFKIELD